MPTSTHRFAWGLGHTTSIQAEVMALFQGIKMLKTLGFTEAIVLGDSQVIINAMVSKTNLVDIWLARTISRIKGMIKSLKLEFFHVLRNNNKEVDVEANKAAQLDAGTFLRDSEVSWDPIP